jgi:hypothetical protein
MRSTMVLSIVVIGGLVCFASRADGQSKPCEGDQALSLSEAQCRIQRFEKFRNVGKVNGALGRDQFEAGIGHVWQESSSGGFEVIPDKQGAAPDDKNPFTSVDFTGIGLANPLKRTVAEVSGIADQGDSSAKIAEFRWKYDAVADKLKTQLQQFAGLDVGRERYGQALFRHYNSGWRVAKVVECPAIDKCPGF